MNHPSFDKAEDRAQAYVDFRNGVTDMASYREAQVRPASTEYVVLPDGTVQFSRTGNTHNEQ